MTNFNVIERDDSFYNKADEFIKLYTNKKYDIKRICEKLNLTKSQYHRLRNYCVEFKNMPLKKKRRKRKVKKWGVDSPKNYCRTQYGTFLVYKTRNGKQTGFGTYKTAGIAEAIVEELKKVDWDKKELKRIQKEVLG